MMGNEDETVISLGDFNYYVAEVVSNLGDRAFVLARVHIHFKDDITFFEFGVKAWTPVLEKAYRANTKDFAEKFLIRLVKTMPEVTWRLA